jgi:hypothetical protein
MKIQTTEVTFQIAGIADFILPTSDVVFKNSRRYNTSILVKLSQAHTTKIHQEITVQRKMINGQ